MSKYQGPTTPRSATEGTDEPRKHQKATAVALIMNVHHKHGVIVGVTCFSCTVSCFVESESGHPEV